METKPWYQSKGVIGGAVAVVVPTANLIFGIDLDQAELTLVLSQIGTAIAGAVALWGRIVATKQIR